MKRLLLSILLAAIFQNAVAQDIKIDAITYEVIPNTNTARIKNGKKAKGNVVLLETVRIKGTNYKVVEISSGAFSNSTINSITIPDNIEEIKSYTFSYCSLLKEVVIPTGAKSIGSHAFANCKMLESVIIPNSVTIIQDNAFAYCRSLKQIVIPNSVCIMESDIFNQCTGLESIVVPDKAPEKVNQGQNKQFKGCLHIREVRANTHLYPKYIYGELDESCSFLLEKYPVLSNSFSYYAYDKVRERIAQWQEKGEFETTEQWCNRVTEEKRKQQLTTIIDELRQEYIAEKTPHSLQGTLGNYNADYSAFPVTALGMNTFYVQVPIEEAPIFKKNWLKVKMQPQYGIVNDHFSILSCTFNLGNKNYRTTQNYSNDVNVSLVADLPPLEIDFKTNTNVPTSPVMKPERDFSINNEIDINIPVINEKRDKTFAIIIGNEDYQRVTKVNFALNDAKIFATYCQKTLGIPETNIRSYLNATYGTMLSALADIKDIAEAYQGDISVIFYYAGHGVPNESDKGAYLLPVDADGSQTEVCLATERLYHELGNLRTRSTLIFMDACFSGAQRGSGMLTAARGIAIKVKTDRPQGNTIVFSAATGEETAFPYKEKNHGMFTYFLLKKIHESQGKVSLGELSDYIISNVAQQSVVINRKKQTPTVIPSIEITDIWRNKTLIGQ